jgi:AcrR family transcriptional regulator
MSRATPDHLGPGDPGAADWHRRVVHRSLRTATQRSIDRGSALVRAATALIERSGGDTFTVQDVADEAGQSLRTLYQYFESKDDLLLAVYEEVMLGYARLIRTAIADLDDPLERLAGALVAAARLPERTPDSINGGLARLRLKLAEVEPELVRRAQVPVAALVVDLVEAAVVAGALVLAVPDAAAATFLLLALNAASITAATLGNDVGARAPAVGELVTFGLQGLGAELAPGWLDDVSARLRLPGPGPA